jgi:hypothetical protein
VCPLPSPLNVASPSLGGATIPPHALSSPSDHAHLRARALLACVSDVDVVRALCAPRILCLSSHTSIPWSAPALPSLCGFTSHHPSLFPWMGVPGQPLAALLGYARPYTHSMPHVWCVRAFDFRTHPLAPRAPPRWHSTRTTRRSTLLGNKVGRAHPVPSSRRHSAWGVCVESCRMRLTVWLHLSTSRARHHLRVSLGGLSLARRARVCVPVRRIRSR